MNENHFRVHFSPFEINTQLFFTKCLPAANLDDRKSFLIAFLAISDQYATFFSTKWLPVSILDDRKSILIAFLTISDQYVTLIFFVHKMAAGGHLGWPKIAFDHICRHFRLIRNFDFFLNFHKMAAGGHFGWTKITFECISRHLRSIHNFFSQNACQRPFWMTENHLWSHFSPFQINMQLFFPQNGCQWPFWMTKNQFWSQLWFFFVHKWLPVTILDDRKSILIAFLTISDQYATLFFLFTKWLPAAILDDQKSLSITFVVISDQYATLIFFKFSQNGCRRPFWMNENHFRVHFSPFEINTQFLFLNFFSKCPLAAILEVRFDPFWMTENHFRSHFSPFQINTQIFFIFFLKWMAASDYFGSPVCAKNNRGLPLCVINCYAKYEVDQWMYDTIRDATSFLSIFIQNGRQRSFCFLPIDAKNHRVLVIWDLNGYGEY